MGGPFVEWLKSLLLGTKFFRLTGRTDMWRTSQTYNIKSGNSETLLQLVAQDTERTESQVSTTRAVFFKT